MNRNEIGEWIKSNICEDMQDDEVNETYFILGNFNSELLEEMLNPISYKLLLKYNHIISPNFIDRDTILDNLKDLILVGGSQNYSIDDYMDWDGFVQEEIDSYYMEYGGGYISYDELQEFYRNLKEQCILD